MAPSEAARHELYTALSNTLGHDPAETLMAHLLPTPAAELATRAELRAEIRDLRAEMNSRFDAINARFDRMLIAQIGGFAALATAMFLS